MMRIDYRSLTAPLILLLLVFGQGQAEAGMRCDGGLVKRGDRMFEVRERCGEPDVAIPLHSVYTIRHGHVPTREEWQYNFGPRRLMRFMRFNNGKLTQVRTGSHGFRSGDGRCSPNALEPGMTQMELQARCGDPWQTEIRITNQRYEVDRLGRVFKAGLPAEDWIYDFGSSRFIRIVTLIHGQVVAVERSSSRGN